MGVRYGLWHYLHVCAIMLHDSILAQYVYLFKYVHKSSSKLYQCNPYDSLILLIYNMCIIVLSFSLFYYMLYCAFRMECVPYVFAIPPGDAPSLSYSYNIRVTRALLLMRRGSLHMRKASLHWCIPCAQCTRMTRTKGACQQWAHRPIETAAMVTAYALGILPVHEVCWLTIH